MSLKNNEKSEPTSNLDDSTKPARSNSKCVPYLSPPNSPFKEKGKSGDKARTVENLGSNFLSPPSSPPRRSSELTVHEEQVKEDKIDVTTLRTLLGLTNGRCGASAKTGRPCRNWSPAAKKAAVASQLESMITLTQSSVDLKAHLDKLASLVHCKNHDGGLPMVDRIKAWTKAFPVGEVSITDPILLVEKQIIQFLALNSTQCLRVEDGTESRCGEGIGGLRVHHCALTINEIVTSSAYLNDAHLDVLLQVLERSMRCSQHTKEKNLQKVASWKSSITGFLINLPEKSAPKENEGSSKHSNTQSTTDSPLTNMSDDPIIRRLTTSIPDFDQDLSAFWPTTYRTSPFEIIERSNRLTDYKSSYSLIKGVINKPLQTVDLRHGHIYMYEVEGNPGFVKIGYTTQSVNKRLEKWDFDCNRAPNALYPIPPRTAEAVPHARRIEELCHAELHHRRIRIYCPGCLKQHLEWFEISSTEAITIIQKWTTWMKTNPYKPTSLRYGQKWTIKMEETARTERMDNFIDEISAAS
ncbi:hypothetical protein FPSE_07800 [Fusarium pseudograminearum CS3096]|uniref:Bacteriophage T5 Orf172 DNA-binding domain-containing protein n=2 Tax=Fusarium pseudograminearum TaxID=101028 RepID=K3UJ92_FUSPC|nr:hypothetical protein FPSE_07800 [Fusarium pseudograminearum CS3096]EKJ72021.1 hypothetical protein FPSE_07800 [Fusarium pseudograminearum CS3096]CEG03228.1 unnamed protein product [Fusarium pseudograminearum CS3487]CEG03617.1 unnamed protein product [Fusarium pseudograminearum CS3487]